MTWNMEAFVRAVPGASSRNSWSVIGMSSSRAAFLSFSHVAWAVELWISHSFRDETDRVTQVTLAQISQIVSVSWSSLTDLLLLCHHSFFSTRHSSVLQRKYLASSRFPKCKRASLGFENLQWVKFLQSATVLKHCIKTIWDRCKVVTTRGATLHSSSTLPTHVRRQSRELTNDSVERKNWEQWKGRVLHAVTLTESWQHKVQPFLLKAFLIMKNYFRL